VRVPTDRGKDHAKSRSSRDESQDHDYKIGIKGGAPSSGLENQFLDPSLKVVAGLKSHVGDIQIPFGIRSHVVRVQELAWTLAMVADDIDRLQRVPNKNINHPSSEISNVQVFLLGIA
jgi:hypothetical protein